MEKLLKPVTTCTNCAAPGYNITIATVGRCRRPGCKGTIKSAIGENDWAKCPSCAAKGWEGNNMRSQCGGFGWLFTRQH